MRVAVVGGGIAGLAAAYELTKLGAEFVLFEATARLGGIVETVRERGFTVECGPDAWVTEKPWARELAEELGLAGELLASNDATRKTYIAREGGLIAVPDGMRMMVPSDLAALDGSALFSEAAKAAFRAELGRAEELRAGAPDGDESVAEFVSRHFGDEVARTIAAPLLAGVFGGDIARLSVRAVMPAFVAMEREYGSLVQALQVAVKSGGERPIFTTLKCGLATLVERIAAELPVGSVRLGGSVRGFSRISRGWSVDGEDFDAVILAVPAESAADLLRAHDARAAELLPREASSAVVVALGFDGAGEMRIPAGFGFLAPEGRLMAATFAHQKFADRAPAGGVLLRAFFGGAAAESLMGWDDASLVRLAVSELEKFLGRMGSPDVAVVRRWPRSLPQYEVGHLERIAEFELRVAELGGVRCVGNAYRGVGLPDLIRDGRAAARDILAV